MMPTASRTFTASLRLGQASAAIAYSGNLTLSAQSRLATAILGKTVSGVVYELKVVLSMFGELNVEVRRAGVLRQTPTLMDDLIGAGHYLLPALKTEQNQEQKTGAVLFWRP